MTSPLTKIAKGVQNIGMNLDPRKIATKVSCLHLKSIVLLRILI